MIFQPAYVGRAWAEYASRIRDIVVAVDQAADIASLLKERGRPPEGSASSGWATS